jgi:hypothetical protein
MGNYWQASVRRPTGDYPQPELLNCLKDLDTQSVEILCIEVDKLRDDEAPAIDTIKEALGRLGSVKILILSYAAATLFLGSREGCRHSQPRPRTPTSTNHRSRFPFV